MSLQFNILNELPAYGPLPKIFSISGQKNCSDGFIVEFKSEEKKSWIGNFQRGLTHFNTVIVHPNNKNIIVIAGGQAYVIDSISGEHVESLESTIQGVLRINDNSILVLNNNFDLCAYNATGKIWRTKRLTIDGIKNLKCDKNTISGEGLAFHDEWFSFEIDINNGKVLDEEKLKKYLPLD